MSAGSVETLVPLRAQGSPQPKRILVVSDSLGRPIHARGIFHYTGNLIRALRACGHEVSLLVERTQSYALPSADETRLAGLSELAARSLRLGEIYHFLSRTDIVNQYLARRGIRRSLTRLLRLPSRVIPLLSMRGLRLLLHRQVTLQTSIVPNDTEQVAFIPERVAHLRHVSAFALCPDVYTLSFACAALGLDVPTVDARGFDIILVDTPTGLRFTRSPGSELVVVVHDLIPLSEPTLGPRWRRMFANNVAVAIEDADSFVFVSADSRRKFERLFPQALAERDVTVLHPSLDEEIANASTSDAGLTDEETTPPYLLAIVSGEPRKNIANLIDAFSMLPTRIGLKIVGHVDAKSYGLGDDDDGAGRRARSIEVVGHVSDARKRHLLAHCAGVVVPSFAEGFGIPIVEGFFFGKPVFCSDIPVFREVAGEHAFYFDPHAPRSIAQAIMRHFDDPARCARLVEQGREECRRRFSLATLTAAVARRFGDAREQSVSPKVAHSEPNAAGAAFKAHPESA